MEGLRLDGVTDWLLLVAAIVVSMGIFMFVWQILKTIIGALIASPIVLLALLFVFGILPERLRYQVINQISEIWHKLIT